MQQLGGWAAGWLRLLPGPHGPRWHEQAHPAAAARLPQGPAAAACNSAAGAGSPATAGGFLAPYLTHVGVSLFFALIAGGLVRCGREQPAAALACLPARDHCSRACCRRRCRALAHWRRPGAAPCPTACSFVEPLAAGSGIPEVKTYLNGVHIKVGCVGVRLQRGLFLPLPPPPPQAPPQAAPRLPAPPACSFSCVLQGLLTMRTLVTKLSGITFSIAAGLIAGGRLQRRSGAQPGVHGG